MEKLRQRGKCDLLEGTQRVAGRTQMRKQGVPGWLPGPQSDHSAKPRCLSQDLEPLFRGTILYPSLSKDLPALSSMHRSHYMLKTFQSQAVGRLPRQAEQSPSSEALKTRQGKTLITLAWSGSWFCFEHEAGLKTSWGPSQHTLPYFMK